MSTDQRPTPPTPLRVAGAITAVEGLIAVVASVVLIVRELAGHREAAANGYGTAAWFGIIGLGVLAGGVALLRGRRWGRAISLVAQILLLPVAYALLTDSNQPFYGVPLAFAALGVLALLFSPASIRWLSGEVDPDDETATEGKPDSGRRR
ncbi:hypothetical protein GCM10009624_04770 [Gordonia sinesedis]